MSATRSRKEHKAYKKYLKSDNLPKCVFCKIQKSHNQLIKETKHFKIINNIFPYSLWDNQAVTDHLMIIPKQHTDSLANMSAEQKCEYVDLVAKYEKQGYNIYSRTPVSTVKSIPHQHTHLIKNDGQTKWLIFLLRKPYMRFTK